MTRPAARHPRRSTRPGSWRGRPRSACGSAGRPPHRPQAPCGSRRGARRARARSRRHRRVPAMPARASHRSLRPPRRSRHARRDTDRARGRLQRSAADGGPDAADLGVFEEQAREQGLLADVGDKIDVRIELRARNANAFRGGLGAPACSHEVGAAPEEAAPASSDGRPKALTVRAAGRSIAMPRSGPAPMRAAMRFRVCAICSSIACKLRARRGRAGFGLLQFGTRIESVIHTPRHERRLFRAATAERSATSRSAYRRPRSAYARAIRPTARGAPRRPQLGAALSSDVAAATAARFLPQKSNS